MIHRFRLVASVFCLTLFLVPGVAAIDDPNLCDIPTEEPDVIVGDLHQTTRNGSVGDITAFSVGTVSCNTGSCWLKWIAGTNEHPVIGQNMYRLKDGRFEQIGMSWLKHGFFAVSGMFCSPDCNFTDGTHLGVNCSDPYSAFFNGKQDELGPRYEVNPWSGFHPHPGTGQSLTGDAIYKRLQVHNDDLNPLLNTGARYFVEGQYVTMDDAAAGNQNNNASHREIEVDGAGTFFDIALVGQTQQTLPAIRAWAAIESGVHETEIQVPFDGFINVSAKATALGGGLWHYEYAVHNLNSHRAARSFSVPVPTGATVTGIGFHDVDYHSGSPLAPPAGGVDWSHNGGAGNAVVWTTESFAVNPNANALRWGTLYNFRFDTDVAPALHEVTIGLFRPGAVLAVEVLTTTPSLCDFDDTCDPGEDCRNCPADCADSVCTPPENGCSCPADCGGPPAEEPACSNGADDDCDFMVDCTDPDCCDDPACSFGDSDGDGHVGCGECNEGNAQVWATPGEVPNLLVAKLAVTKALLSWSPVADPGATTVLYEVIRSKDADDFYTDPRCFAETAGTTTVDPQTLASLYFYLVRAKNDCPDGLGPLGESSSMIPRVAPSCDP